MGRNKFITISEFKKKLPSKLRDNFNYNITYYNRFKKALPDDVLTKGFMHIFFTRPDLNILSSSGDDLNSVVAKDAFFKYKWMQKKDLVKQLVKDSGATSDFLMLLSNKASSFSLRVLNMLIMVKTIRIIV